MRVKGTAVPKGAVIVFMEISLKDNYTHLPKSLRTDSDHKQ